MKRWSQGGGMFRAVGRAAGSRTIASVKDRLSSTSAGTARPPARHVVTIAAASAPSSPTFAGASAAAGDRSGPHPCFCDYDDWESVAGVEEEDGFENPFGLPDRYVFGRAPSVDEAEGAITTLNQIFGPLTFPQVMEDGYPLLDVDAADRVIEADTMQRSFSTESETDWIEPAVHLYSTQTFQSPEHENVLNAFHLLQVNPSVQRMVVALSSDKAVWDAVMNNDVVQELKKTFYEAENRSAENGEPQNSEEQPDVATRILKWISDNTKAQVENFFSMITKLVSELFNSQEKDKNEDYFDVTLRSSFMLSVVVFIIVVVTRIQNS